MPLVFDNQLVNTLPADANLESTPRAVRPAFSWVQPTPVSAPKLLAYSPSVADLLGLSAEEIASAEFTAVFSGNQFYPGMQSNAVNYGGHQFGRWAGQLGDGRAISLGETLANGRRWELQLKGAGPTPYSRHADGRAVLRSSLREFICSEAMQHLGVPTTRALSLISTGDAIERDMFYDGNRKAEPGAIVCRVAPSFIRFGNFELPSARGDHALLAQWVDFCIARDFPHLTGANARADWFLEVCTRTATLIAHWLRVGFVHGVMNTDNMSILGLTIDYGPYGWLENFDPGWTPNTTDAEGKRYCYARQPEIAHWNLGCLAQALAPLFADPAPLQEGLRRYSAHFNQQHCAMNAAKLGLAQWRDEDVSLLSDLFRLMQSAEMDMSLTFQGLGEISMQQPPSALGAFEPAFYRPELRDKHATALIQWLARYYQRASAELSDSAQVSARQETMRRANPLYVPRNYLAQQAIDSAENGDCRELHALIDALSQPYTARQHCARFAQKRPEWARVRAGCSMLSCSS
jgi:serine/tyrosine/threonine adenylyltransferase